jgi:precorrin isomerase
MTNIQQAIDDLIDAADILVSRRDHVTGDVALIPRTSISRLERALEQAQKAVKEGRPVIRDTRVVEVRCLYEEMEELGHIASEMAEALERIRTNERNNYLSCDEMLCAECLDDDQCPGKIADMALQKWEQWREEQS